MVSIIIVRDLVKDVLRCDAVGSCTLLVSQLHPASREKVARICNPLIPAIAAFASFWLFPKTFNRIKQIIITIIVTTTTVATVAAACTASLKLARFILEEELLP